MSTLMEIKKSNKCSWNENEFHYLLYIWAKKAEQGVYELMKN